MVCLFFELLNYFPEFNLFFVFFNHTGQPIRQDGRIVKEIKLANKYTWLKTKDVFEKFEVIGSGFKQLGLTSDDRVIMFADTRIEWFISSFSLMLFQIPIATLFSNLGNFLFYFFNFIKI